MPVDGNHNNIIIITPRRRLFSMTKTSFFVLEAPGDQDLGLEDYITAHKEINSFE